MEEGGFENYLAFAQAIGRLVRPFIETEDTGICVLVCVCVHVCVCAA